MDIENIGVKKSGVEKNIQRKQQIDTNEEKIQQTTQLVDMKVSPQKDTTLSKWGNLIEDFGKIGAEYSQQQTTESKKQFSENAVIDYQGKNGKKTEEELRKSTNFKHFGNYSDYSDAYDSLDFNGKLKKNTLNFQKKMITETNSDDDKIKLTNDYYANLKKELNSQRDELDENGESMTDKQYTTRLIQINDERDNYIDKIKTGEAVKSVKEREKLVRQYIKLGKNEEDIEILLSLKGYNDKEIEAIDIEKKKSYYDTNKNLIENDEQLDKEETELQKDIFSSKTNIKEFYDKMILEVSEDTSLTPEEQLLKIGHYEKRKSKAMGISNNNIKKQTNVDNTEKINIMNNKNSNNDITTTDAINEDLINLEDNLIDNNIGKTKEQYVKSFIKANDLPFNIEETDNAIANLTALSNAKYKNNPLHKTDKDLIKDSINKLKKKKESFKKQNKIEKDAIDKKAELDKYTKTVKSLVIEKRKINDGKLKKLTADELRNIAEKSTGDKNISNAQLNATERIVNKYQAETFVNETISDNKELSDVPKHLEKDATIYAIDKQKGLLDNILNPEKNQTELQQLNAITSYSKMKNFTNNSKFNKDGVSKLTKQETKIKDNFLETEVFDEKFLNSAQALEKLEKTGNGVMRKSGLDVFDIKNEFRVLREGKSENEEPNELEDYKLAINYLKNIEEHKTAFNEKLILNEDYKSTDGKILKKWVDKTFAGYNPQQKKIFSDYAIMAFSQGKIDPTSSDVREEIIELFDMETYEYGYMPFSYNNNHETYNSKPLMLPKWTGGSDKVNEGMDLLEEVTGKKWEIDTIVESNGEGQFIVAPINKETEQADRQMRMPFTNKTTFSNWVESFRKKKEEVDDIYWYKRKPKE